MNDQNLNGSGNSNSGSDNDSYYQPSNNGGPASQPNGPTWSEQGNYGAGNSGDGANAGSGSSAGMGNGTNPNPGYGSGYGDYGAPSGGQSGQPGQAGQPGQHGQPGKPGQPGGNAYQESSVKAESRGFFEALFDFSFSSFITIKFAKFVYALCILAVAFVYLASVITAFTSGAGEGLMVLIFGAVVALVQIIFTRVALEGLISIVRTAQNTAALREVATGR